MPNSAPDATELAAAFDLGAPVAPAEWVASGWGGHNHLWRLTTSRGRWAIKQVGRDLSLDPDDTLALELAAYAGEVPMPRPIPTKAGRCFAMLDGKSLPLPRMGRRCRLALARPCAINGRIRWWRAGEIAPLATALVVAPAA